jgi:serine protease Do
MTRLAMLVVAGVCLLPALLLVCATAWTDAGQDRMLRSTVLVDMPDGHGAGVILPGGAIITNAHVVAGVDSVTLEAFDGARVDASVAWRGEVSKLDVAILKPDRPIGEGVPLRCADPRMGEQILAVGHPRTARWVVTSGRVAGLRKMHQDEDESPYWLADLAINPGNSGGPVFDLYGQVIGMATALIGYGNPMFGLSGNTGISLITPSSALCEALAKHGGGDA